MTIVFFDERFSYVGENSTALRVYQQGDNAAPLVLANIKAPKNGFAYIYLSNESSEPVYFDDFTVSDNRGRIIEEDHYYAFGLKIAGISSKKLPDPNEGSIDNKNLYNDKELFDDADIDWYDYGFRNYDPQIGRFLQLDPLTDDYPHYTPYQYAGNEPIANVDMDGLEEYQVLAPIVVKLSVKAARTAAPIVLGAAKIGARAAIPLLNTSLKALQIVIGNKPDNTRNVLVSNRHQNSMLGEIGDFVQDQSHGRGSHQKIGIVFDGNDGTTDNYSDHADIIVDNIHMGSFMELLSMYKPSGVDGSITNPTVENTVSSVDAVSKAGEQTYKTVHEENPKWSKPKQTFVNQTGIFVDDSSVNADGSKTYFQRIQKLKHPIKVPTTYRTKVN